jgi:hypothetical protein
MGRSCSIYGEKRNAFRTLMRKTGGNRPLGKHWRGWEGNIRMDIRETGWGCMSWVDLARDRDQIDIADYTYW